MQIIPDHSDGLNEGDTVKIEIPAADGDMTITAEVLERRKADEEHPSGRYFKIKQIKVKGEDRTQEYLEKAFNGEQVRGMPDQKLEQADIEVIE